MPSAGSTTAATAGYMGPSGASSCVVERAGAGTLVPPAGFTAHAGYYGQDCLSPYAAGYSYPGAGTAGTGGSCLDSYLKVRPSPYPCAGDYPSYFTRVAGLHHHHHAAHAAAAAASRSAAAHHVIPYDYPSA